MSRFLHYFFLLHLLIVSLSIPAEAQSENVQKLLDQRIQKKYNVGIIVAVVTPAGIEYFSAGKVSNIPNAPPVTPETIFPLASITKIFTTLAFANQVIQHKVALNAKAQPYMPKPIILPEWHGQALRLVDLATHTAALPPIPGIVFTDNFYATVTVETIAQFLNHYHLPYRPGTRYLYGDLSIALLGLAVEDIAGENFQNYIEDTVLKPLHMHNTFFQVPAEKKPQLVTGYNPADEPVSFWQFNVMAQP